MTTGPDVGGTLAVALHWPDLPTAKPAKVKESVLIAFAQCEGLAVKRGEEGVPVLLVLERSLGSFDGRVTNDPRPLPDMAAQYALDVKT